MQKNNDSFAREMAKIGRQAEAERLEEIKTERRRTLYGKVRKGMLVLVLLTAVGFAYQQRAQIKESVTNLGARTGLTGGSGKSLTGYSEANNQLRGQVGGLQDTALQRNQLVEDLAAGAKPGATTASATAAK